MSAPSAIDLETLSESSPSELIDLFLAEWEADKAPSTYYNNKGHMDQFREWLADNRMDHIEDLDGKAPLQYKIHLKSDDSKNRTTVGNHFSTLRTFFKWSARYDFTDSALTDAMESPDFNKHGAARERMIPFDHAKDLLDYLKKFKYTTKDHIMVAIMCHTGCRRWAMCGLDLDDYSPVRERDSGQYGLFRFHYRPDTGTPLKNDEGGEREVMIWPHFREIIEDYIDTHRRILPTNPGGSR